MNRRLSTLYDYACLRLHCDGTRVQQSDENYHIPSRKRFAVKNSRGNWIATDAAGGLGTVRRTYVRKGTNEALEGREVEKKGECLTVENEPKRRRVDYRREKKQRFVENLDFLDAHATSYSMLTQGSCLPVPPSVRHFYSGPPKRRVICRTGIAQVHTLFNSLVLHGSW